MAEAGALRHAGYSLWGSAVYKVFISLALLLLASAPAEAVTYYVGKSGSDANSCATAQSSTAGNRKLTLASGAACLSAGDTLTIGSGTYAEALPQPTNGSSGAYTTVQAEVDGGVIITGSCCTAITKQYIDYVGLRLHSSNPKTVEGNHLKFRRTEFKGGPSTGNNSTLTIGTNNFDTTSDNLFEDIWVHGSGGRYNILVYNQVRMVIRRAVVRHDGGWSDGGSADPEAGINLYNTGSSAVINCIVLDSNLTYSTWQSAFYSVQNTASTGTNQNNQWIGNIALNNTSGADGASMRFDGNGAQSGHTLTDFVLWHANWGLNMSYAANVGFTATRLTIGRSTAGMTATGGTSGGTKSINNIRLFNATVSNITPTNSATGTPTYLTQPVSSIGANIVNKIGTDGTLQGETGWNTDTGNVLWPYPNEARIKQEMCTDVGITRGFCSDTSLTNYIMNYLGNGNPYAGGGGGSSSGTRMRIRRR